MATPVHPSTRSRYPAPSGGHRGGRSRRRSGGAGRAFGRLVGVLVVLAVLAGGAWAALREIGPRSPVVVVERCTATSDGVDFDLAPDQAGNAALISAVVVRRGLAARAATIAVATAMQESKLRNITYGDRDSLGLFQQRPSQGWGTAAQVQDPVYATNAFLSSLIKVDGYATLPIGDVAQRIQRSAYPQAYAAHESSARAFSSALSGYSPAALSCALRPVAHADALVQSASSSGYWPRTQAVVDRLSIERGPVATAPTDGGAGVRLGTPASGTDAIRNGWSLAAWSVAHADDLGIVAVGTDGKIWRRDTPGTSWAAIAADQATTWAPQGATVVVMAGGALP